MNALLLSIALTITGECGSIGHGCEIAVAHVLANRVGTPGFATTIQGALDGFYARAREPTPEAIRVARLLWTDPDTLRDGKYLYAYSNDDRRTQGWRQGDSLICGHGLCLHLSTTWPGMPAPLPPLNAASVKEPHGP